MPITKAFATSIYDDTYQTTTDVNLYNVACGGLTHNTYPMSFYDLGAYVASDSAMAASITYGDSFRAAVQSGQFGISNYTKHYDNGDGTYRNSIKVFWLENTDLSLAWNSYGSYRYSTWTGSGRGYSVFVDAYDDPITNECKLHIDHFAGALISDNDSVKNVFVQTTSPNYPSGYAGTTVIGANDADIDGLTIGQEYVQGTSDSEYDTDGDGLSDYTESIWNTNYADQFCDTAPTPDVCADPDPKQKDLFVQIDWTDDGTEVYKPTGTQLDLVEDKFAAMGIRFHADIGDYGGGNELTLPSYEAIVDVRDEFYGYKWGYETEGPANFDEDRHHIWHYMITGYNFFDGDEDSDTLSGKAEPGGDDTFISFGLLDDNPGFYSDFDDAVAGTIVHELGHNLCLAGTAYTGQDSSCLFSGVDSDNASVHYESTMNYDYQFMNLYSYSDGMHGTGDHDDLAGIVVGFNDFQNDDDTGVGGPS